MFLFKVRLCYCDVNVIAMKFSGKDVELRVAWLAQQHSAHYIQRRHEFMCVVY